jgi:reactive intermediate/imine deaminase
MKATLFCITLLLGTIGNAQEIQRSNPDGMTQPTSYTHLVKFDRLMFIAGQVALDADGNVIGAGDMKAQVRQIMENLKTILAAEGADFSDIVKINTFTTDIETFFESGDIRREYFGSHAPAGTLVQVERLARPVFLVEIEAIAVSPD